MKKTLYRLLFAAAALFAFVGCAQKEGPQQMIVGEWHYSGEELGQAVDVYLGFDADGSFDLYQMIGEGLHRYYTGTYSIEGAVVSGVYSNGNPWASDYSVSFQDGSMTMKSTSVDYSITYTKKIIPDEIRDLNVVMKSADEEVFVPFL